MASEFTRPPEHICIMGEVALVGSTAILVDQYPSEIWWRSPESCADHAKRWLSKHGVAHGWRT